MSSITREHLELAALAAGLTYRGDQWSSLAMTGDGVWQSWRPHTDIAEAARLALRLGLSVHTHRCSNPRVCAYSSSGAAHGLYRRKVDDVGDQHFERAYCEAVTLCAAMLAAAPQPPAADHPEDALEMVRPPVAELAHDLPDAITTAIADCREACIAIDARTSAKPARQPLSEEAVAVACGWLAGRGLKPTPRELIIARAIERAHGIGVEGGAA